MRGFILIAHKPELKDFEPLKAIIQADDTESITCYTNFQNIYFNGTTTHVMIRDNNNMPKRPALVLANISLVHQHQGIGTNIIQWLESYAKRNGYHCVIIESVLTQAMHNLAQKLGYVRESQDEWNTNYIKTIH